MLLGQALLSRWQAAGRLDSQSFVVKTLVSSDMLVRLAEAYHVRAITDVLTGFKWIGLEIDRHGPENFVFGYEECTDI